MTGPIFGFSFGNRFNTAFFPTVVPTIPQRAPVVDRPMKNWMIKMRALTDIESLLDTIESIPETSTFPKKLWQSKEIDGIRDSFRLLALGDYKYLFVWMKKKLPRTEGTFDAHATSLIKQQTSPLKFLYELLDESLTVKKFHLDKDFKENSYYFELDEIFENLLTRGLVNR